MNPEAWPSVTRTSAPSAQIARGSERARGAKGTDGGQHHISRRQRPISCPGDAAPSFGRALRYRRPAREGARSRRRSETQLERRPAPDISRTAGVLRPSPSAGRAPEPRGVTVADASLREAPAQARGEEALAFAMNVAQSALGVLSARRGLALKSLLGVLLALATAGLLRDWPLVGDAPVALVPPAAWVDIAKPYPLFELLAPSSSGQPVYTARRHAPGGGREDVLTFGQFGGAKPFLRMTSIGRATRRLPMRAISSTWRAAPPHRASASCKRNCLRRCPPDLATSSREPWSFPGQGTCKRGNCRGFRLALEETRLDHGRLDVRRRRRKARPRRSGLRHRPARSRRGGPGPRTRRFLRRGGGRKSRACTDTARRK